MSFGAPYRTKKRFGQNFLRDQQVVSNILAAAELTGEDRVLEIGPGLGALTERLLQHAGHVVIMELDRDLLSRWEERAEPKLEILAGDALKLDWQRSLAPGPLKLVANLPYNISSQIIFKIIEHRQLFSRLVLMFQKEVGERLCADPGTRNYGSISVFTQLWFDVRRVCKVPPQAFKPAPKVDSVVLSFTPLSQARVEISDHELFTRLVKGAFYQRRKTLRNSLLGAGFIAEQLDPVLAECEILPTRRGETLALDEFARLTLALDNLNR